MNDIVEGGVAPADHAWSLPESWSRRISSSRLVVMALAVALAAWAQQLTDHRASVGLTLACYGAAALLYALFAPALGREPEKATTPHTRIRFHAVSGTTEHESGAPPTDSRRRGRRRSYFRVRSGYLLWAVVFAALSFASLGGNRFNGQGIVPWILGMAFCFLALPGEAGERWGARGRRMLATLKLGRWRITWTTWGLILALALGAALRLYHLWELPSDLGWDLPYNYSDVQRILHGEYLVFFPDNYGREGMFFYLAAAVSRVEGASPFALRLTSALIGIATIPAIYALARECVDREMGVYAAILLAANKWHLVLTRSGYRVSLMPLFVILTLYGLARGLRRGRPRDWAWAGLFLGLGLSTYKAFIYAVPIVIGCAAASLLLSLHRRTRAGQGPAIEGPMMSRGADARALGAGIGLMMLVAVVASVPLLRFIADSPQVYMARELQAVRLVNESLSGRGTSWWQNTTHNIVVSVLMYNYEGDGNSRFGVPYQRHLGFISGMLLILGMATAIAHLRRGSNALLVLATLGFIAPMTMSMLVGEMPNCFRSAGTIGPVLVLGAMVIRGLRGELAGFLARLRTKSFRLEYGSDSGETRYTRTFRLGINATVLPVLLVMVLFLGETRETSRYYLRDFALVTPDIANYSQTQEMARTIVAFGEPAAYVKVWPYWYDGRAMNVYLNVAGHAPLQEILDLGPDRPPLQGFQGRILVLLHPEDQADLATLEAFFPHRATIVHGFPDGTPAFVAFYGEN